MRTSRRDRVGPRVWLAAALTALAGCAAARARPQGGVEGTLAKIQHVVVIYAENRSFDHLFGLFPGADGLAQAPPERALQRDRDGAVLPRLPPVWSGAGPARDPAFGADLPNVARFPDAPEALRARLTPSTRSSRRTSRAACRRPRAAIRAWPTRRGTRSRRRRCRPSVTASRRAA